VDQEDKDESLKPDHLDEKLEVQQEEESKIVEESKPVDDQTTEKEPNSPKSEMDKPTLD